MAKKILLCPECFSSDLNYEAAYFGGQKYRCKECGYVGAFAVEAAPGEVERFRAEARRGGEE